MAVSIAPREAINPFKVFLTQGRYLGVHTWVYVKVDSPKLPLFQHALRQGTVDAAQYGEVIFSGWGEKPPEEVRMQVEALYA